MRAIRVLVLLALAILTGCGPQEPPPEPVETLVAYSLEPLIREGKAEAEPGDVWFHTHLVLGQTSVTDPNVQREVVGAVQKGIEEAEQDPAKQKMCLFMPRHGVHQVAKDNTITDWVICFSCGEVKVFRNGKPLESFEKEILPTRERYKGNLGNTTRRAQKLLNDTLRSANVELAPGADKGE